MSFEEIQREFGQDLSGFMPFVNKNIEFRTEEALEKQISSGKIDSDDYEEQEEFRQTFRDDLLANGRQKQFSKGFDRLRAWLNLAYRSHPSLIDIDKHGNSTITVVKILDDPRMNRLTKLYVLSGLIVIFQVFGDGNHRTAYEYFKRSAGRELTNQEKQLIGSLNAYTYSWAGIMQNKHPLSILEQIIETLSSKFNHMNHLRGGKSRKIKNKSRKNKTKKVKSKKHSKPKHHKGGKKKIKTCWDSNIISPVFFGYPLKN